jgi:dihydrofolate reductase
MQLSLDGFVEGRNKDMSWLFQEDQEAWDDIFISLETTDAVLVGRKMFPDYSAYWQSVLDNPKALASERHYAQWAAKTNHYVFSSTLEKTAWPHTTIVRGDLKEEVLKLKQQPGKDIVVFGGAHFASSCINAGVIDEYRLLVNPVLLGGGLSISISLQEKTTLKLQEAKALKSGVVKMLYTPVRPL